MYLFTFRQAPLGLLVLSLLASPANGQSTPVICDAQADTPFLRSEGRAEFVGDIKLICSGGTPGAAVLANVYAAYYVGNLYAGFASPIDARDSLLLVGEPSAPILGTDLFQGTLFAAPAFPTQVRFNNVVIPYAASNNPIILRITNVRFDATQATASLSPKATEITVSLSGILIRNPQLRAGYVIPGQSMQLFGQHNFIYLIQPTLPGLTFTGNMQYRVEFSESFPNAFRRRNTATSSTTPTATADQAALGTNYGTETGYYNSALPSTNGLNQLGLATQGTRLIARFSNIPAGVSLSVSLTQGSTTSLGYNTFPSAKARLVTTDAQGAGLFNPVAGSQFAPLTVTSGTAMAVWEVTDSDPAILEKFTFDVNATYATPSTAVGTVIGQLGPLGPAGLSDSTSSVPRFGSASPVSATTCTRNCLSAPDAININYTVGSPLPSRVGFGVYSSTLAPVDFKATATSSGAYDIAPPNLNWLTLSNTGATVSYGTTPLSGISLYVNPIGFSPGQYPAFVTLENQDGSSIAKRVFVLLTVFPRNITNSGTLDCSANNGVPPIIRFPGVAEKIADIVVNCTSPSTGATNITTNVQVTLNTNLTSRLNGTTSDALLLVNEPSPPFPTVAPQAVYRGEQTSRNSVLFRNVVVPAASTSQPILRITNLLADTSSLGTIGTPNIAPSLVKANITVSGISLQNPAQYSMAYVLASPTFNLRDAANNPLTAITFPGTSAGPSGAAVSYLLNFNESPGGGFKKRNVATSAANPLALSNQSSPGAIYNTETNFYFAGFPATLGFNTAGLATQGTRLLARFNDVPAGVALYVTTQPVTGSSTSLASRLIQTDGNGAGSYNEVASSVTGTFGPTTVTLAPVNLTNGSGIAVWEILDSNPLVHEEARFGVVAVYNSPQTGNATVSGVLAPLSTVNTSDSFSPIPRYTSIIPTPPTCQDLTCLSVPTSAALAATVGGLPVSTPLSLTDNGQPTQFTVQTFGASWLRVSSFGGTTPATLTLTVDPTGLSAGTYSTNIVIRTDTFIQPNAAIYNVYVSFTVTGPVVAPPVIIPPSPPFLLLTPERLTFQVVQGSASSTPQQLRVEGDANQGYVASTNAAWLRVSPLSGQVPAQLSVTISPSGLAIGEYVGLVTVSTAGSVSTTATVRLSIIDPPQLLPLQTSLAFKTIDGNAPQILYLTAKGRQLTYSAAVTTESGNWLSVTPNTGQTPVNLTVTVNATGLAAGTYKGAVVLTTTDIITSAISVPVTFEVGPAKPAILTILNGASFSSGGVSPGMLVSITGTSFGTAGFTSGQLDETRSFKTNLLGVRVLFDGIAAPIISMSRTQVNVMVPYLVAGRGSTSVVVETANGSSAAMPIPVVPSAPAIFAANATGKGGAAALNTDQLLNTASNAAARGSVVTIFATGEGLLSPAGRDGSVATTLATPLLLVSVTVGGLPAIIEYAGSAPGLVTGILQVNLRIPNTATIGSSIPLILSIGGTASSADVTLAVK